MPIRRISSELVGEVCGSLGALTVLRLSHNQIERIENLEPLSSLTRLDLSHNRIAAIEGLETLTSLTHLSLASNRIRETRGLESLRALEVLLLADNLIEKRTDVRALEWLPALHTLSLARNPLTNEPSHRANLMAALPRLCWLDGEAVRADPSTGQVRPGMVSTAGQDAVASTSALHAEAATLKPITIDTHPSLGLMGTSEPAETPPNGLMAYMRKSSELLAAHRAAQEGSCLRRSASANDVLLDLPVPIHRTPAGHFAVSLDSAWAEVARLQSELAAERRSLSAMQFELQAARERELEAKEELSAMSVQLQSAHSRIEAERAQARAQLEAERATVRRYRAYISVATVPESDDIGGTRSSEAAAAQQRPVHVAKSGPVYEAVEALRTEKELLQMRLDAMVKLLEIQEETAGAAFGAAVHQMSGDGGASCGRRDGSNLVLRTSEADLLSSALQTQQMHPDASATALLSMVHAWRQKTFEQLVRVQSEIRSRKRSNSHLEAELVRERTKSAALQRVADAAAAREASSVASLVAERAARHRSEAHVEHLRRALVSAEKASQHEGAGAREMVQSLRLQLPAMIREAEGFSREASQKLAALQARVHFAVERIDVFSKLTATHKAVGRTASEVAQCTNGELQLAASHGGVDGTTFGAAGQESPPNRCPCVDEATLSASVACTTLSFEAAGQSDESAHLLMELARLREERGMLLRRMDARAQAEAVRRQAEADEASERVRKAEEQAKDADMAAAAGHEEILKLRVTLQAHETRMQKELQRAAAEAKAAHEAAAAMLREAAMDRERADEARLVLQQTVSSLQAELRHSRDELARISDLSARQKEKASAAATELRVEMSKMEAMHVEELNKLRATIESATTAAAERATSAAVADAEEKRSRLEAQLDSAKRDVVKAEVARKALQRENSRLKAHSAEAERTKFEYLEDKIRSRDVQINTLRKERNSLLAALRREQQQRLAPIGEKIIEPMEEERTIATSVGTDATARVEATPRKPALNRLASIGKEVAAQLEDKDPQTDNATLSDTDRRRRIPTAKLEELRALSSKLLS